MQNPLGVSFVSLLISLFLNSYKAEGILPAKPEAVFKCLKPEAGGLREKWDKNVKKLLIIEIIDEVSTIQSSFQCVSGTFWPLSTP